MTIDIVALGAIVAGGISLWQPRHFRIAVGVYLLLFGVLQLGLLRS